MTSVKIDSRWIGLHGPDQPDLVDPERTDGHGSHQQHPDPADGPVRQRALGRGELDDAEHERGHRREGMKRDRGSGIEQWREAHEQGSWRRLMAGRFEVLAFEGVNEARSGLGKLLM